jgi:hypothetical protein
VAQVVLVVVLVHTRLAILQVAQEIHPPLHHRRETMVAAQPLLLALEQAAAVELAVWVATVVETLVVLVAQVFPLQLLAQQSLELAVEVVVELPQVAVLLLAVEMVELVVVLMQGKLALLILVAVAVVLLLVVMAVRVLSLLNTPTRLLSQWAQDLLQTHPQHQADSR